MRRKTTIFRQLLGSVLLPVVLLIAGLSYYSYYQKEKQIEQAKQEHIESIAKETADFLSFFDKTILELEKDMSEAASHYSYLLVDSIFAKTDSIETADLSAIRQQLGMDSTLYDIYIVDTNGVVVNTTFPKDLGLDFFGMGDYFVEHFNKVWQAQEFVEDRISIEIATALPKKYTYHSTHDTLYVIEMGVYNDAATNLLAHFIQDLNTMPDKYGEIDTVSLYLGTNQFMCYQGHTINAHEEEAANTTLRESQNTSVSQKIDGVTYFSDFRYIFMEESHLHDGYVLRIVHNDKQVKKLQLSELKDFGINLLVFVLPIFLLILWRARVISKPISDMVVRTDSIRQGNLSERVSIQGRNEIAELGEHFNDMVGQLQESYESLEHKVEERTAELKEQKEIVEEKQKEIVDSITYAKRIQEAILPPESQVNALLPNSFILYKPKDIVAGDFYWMDETNEGVLFAAADCTGHGVPGAMVSVVCNNALNRSVREFNLLDPGAILDKTKELVVEQFEKSAEEVKDGMDISLCRLQGTDLFWAGANNPLWIIRKGSDVIEEYKPNKQAIGKTYETAPYDTHKISLNSGDVFYIFSDGYADQFGGKKGKKLKNANLKKLLISNADMDMAHQKEVLNEMFEDWKGEFEQLDDVCVIGVRIP